MTVKPQFEDFVPLDMSDAELFVRDHVDRFSSWILWAACGGLAHINLANNDAIYDRFIPPEIARLLERISSPHELTFVHIDDGKCLCLMDAVKAVELMEAAHE